MGYKEDGVDHIRVHIKAKTELGRQLSEFYVRPFRLPELGEFNHLIGLSLYLQTGMDISELRHLPPYECLRRIHRLDPASKQFTLYYDTYSKGVIKSLESDVSLFKTFVENPLPYLIYRETPGDLDGDDRTWLAIFYNRFSEAMKERMKLLSTNPV